jgi:hypothetical protein
MPCSIAPAASSSDSPSGTGTVSDSGISTRPAALPSVWDQATRSPTAVSVTPGPTASTVPAPSLPITYGVDIG